jgi:hypothetical protein
MVYRSHKCRTLGALIGVPTSGRAAGVFQIDGSV